PDAALAEGCGDGAVHRPDELARAVPDRAGGGSAVALEGALDPCLLGLHRLDVLLELAPGRPCRVQRGPLATAHARQSVLLADEPALDVGDLVAALEDRR